MKKLLKYGGFYFCVTLFAVLAILRLSGAIGLSWWWICSPMYIPLLALIILLTILMFMAYGAEEFEDEYYN